MAVARSLQVYLNGTDGQQHRLRQDRPFSTLNVENSRATADDYAALVPWSMPATPNL